MKTAICYYSRHHENTLKVLKTIAEGRDVDLICVKDCEEVNMEPYDTIGFASGIYYGRFHEAVLNFAKQFLPTGKEVFFVYTCGSLRGGYTKAIADTVREKQAHILGEYGCRGFDTFGPFKLVGGLAKGHPDTEELQKGVEFYQSVEKKSNRSVMHVPTAAK